MGDWGRIHGTIQTEWLDDTKHREMRILAPCTYIDRRGLAWEVSVGDIINGVSSGWFLRRLFPRYVGKPRKPSAFHDVYCDLRTRPSWMVHRMFYECLRCMTVWSLIAWIMWFVVRVFGPRF